MSELDRLKRRLFTEAQNGVRDVKAFRGSNRDATAEDMARGHQRRLDELEKGKFEAVADLDD